MRFTVDWFLNIFGTTIWEEGWYIVYNNRNRFTIEPVDKPDKRVLTSEECVNIASEYGWSCSLERLIIAYEIISFDINKLTRNKHLLTADELGLL